MAWKNRWYYVILIPAVLVIFFFSYKPIYGIIIAFKDYSPRLGILKSKWVGLANFQRMVNYGNFWQLMQNTLVISSLKLVAGTFCTIALALLYNELRSPKFKRTVQSVSYLPHFISWVILGGIIRELFSPTRGVVNDVIKSLGGRPIYFLADPNYFVLLLLVTYLWQSVGWGTIIYLAAISSIDQEQYESALIDGANRFQRARYITLPGIMPTITTLLILSLGGILNAGFDQVFNLYNAQVYAVADIIDTYVYRTGLIKFNFSYSAAIGVFKNVIGILLVIGSNIAIKRMTGGEYKIW